MLFCACVCVRCMCYCGISCIYMRVFVSVCVRCLVLLKKKNVVKLSK